MAINNGLGSNRGRGGSELSLAKMPHDPDVTSFHAKALANEILKAVSQHRISSQGVTPGMTAWFGRVGEKA